MYRITTNTKLLQRIKKGTYQTFIVDGYQTIYSHEQIETILNDACLQLGTSMQGRIDFSKEVLHSTSMLPLPIHPEKGIFMFPTQSLRSHNLSYLSYYQISSYEKHHNSVKVYFKDQTSFLVATTIKKFDYQMKRTSQIIADFYYKIL